MPGEAQWIESLRRPVIMDTSRARTVPTVPVKTRAAMVSAAKYPTTVDTLISARGGHNIGVWKSVEPQSFTWLSQHLEAPKTTTYSALPEMIGGVTG